MVDDVINFNIKFLSTPSARRATYHHPVDDLVGVISIHALREEGDLFPFLFPASRRNFYPRPPRGGRRTIPVFSPGA